MAPLRASFTTVLLRWTVEHRPTDAPAAGLLGMQGGVTGITRVRLVGGQITESWTRWDAARALRQLWLILPQ